MPVLTVSSIDYKGELAPLLERRVSKHGLYGLTDAGCGVRIELSSGELPALALALSELMLFDLRPFELSRLVDLLPVTLRDKRRILPAALMLSGSAHMIVPVSAEVLDFLESSSRINPEGFLRFRLQYVLEGWARAVDIAASAR